MIDASLREQVRRARAKFAAMAAAYTLGVLNDNFFKQAAMLLAVGTDRESLQGYMLMLFSAPFVIFAAPAGWLADRFPKRAIVIGSKALEVAAMVCGAVGIVGGSWGLILAMVFTMALQSAIFGPALNGSIPELYPPAYVTTANGLLKAFVTAGILLGVAMAGFLLDWGGRAAVAAGALAVAVLGFLGSLGVPGRPAADPRAAFPWNWPVETFRTLRDAFRDRLLGATIAADVFIWFVGSVQILLINVLGKRQFGYGDAATSGLIVAELGGIAAGGLLSGRLARGQRWHRVLVPSAAALGGVMLLMPLAGLAGEPLRYLLLLALLAPAGMAGGLFMIPCEAFIQVRPPAERRGAVIAAANCGIFAGIMFSGLVGNALNATVAPTTGFALLGFLSLAAAVAVGAALPPGERGRPPRGPLDVLIRWLAWFALRLRYRIRTEGLAAVAAGGMRGTLFLPNHPALIDPIILGTLLHKTFAARFLADQEQVDRFLIRYLARRIGVIPIPDPAKAGPAARQAVEEGLRRCVEALRGGENLVLYPAGHLAHGRREELHGTSAVRYILHELPDVRVVLVRTRGLWGSRFSFAYGKVPQVGQVLRKGMMSLLAGGVFFAPKRPVAISFHQPPDLPRRAGREELNRWLERFYNADAPPAAYIPYTPWERGGQRTLPEPDFAASRGDLATVPPGTRRTVEEYLRDRSGLRELPDEADLARDLGLDSLGRADLLAWLSGEFGFPPGDVEALRTVGDVMLAASGQSLSARLKELSPIPRKWFAHRTGGLVALPGGQTIPSVFLAQARVEAGRAITADQASGVRTYRDVVLGVLVLSRAIARLPGRHVGILLPAGVAADVAYLAALFAGKTPVMINWTVGPANLEHCLGLVGVERILTAGRVVSRLESLGTDLSPLAGRLVMLETIAAQAGRAAKLWAWFRSRVSWRALDRAAAGLRADAPAVILFTSGSEALPKAVPLSHANILTNVRDLAALNVLHADDRLLGILPPFHSFGLTVTTVLPLCMGVPVAHHPDPTEAPMLGRLVEAYGTTILVGTPTFLAAIARASTAGQLAPLRLAVTGAEKCPDRTYELLGRLNGRMEILEGYGVTECSPIISVNRPGRVRHGTIGEPLPSVELAIVDVETESRRAGPGESGMLLVRGPAVFGGYLHYEGRSPFVSFEGRPWYRTGDLVSRDEAGVLTFRGRLKRFVKLGGEMVSLPAIEAVLEPQWPADEATGAPRVAVEAAGGDGPPEIILFTTLDLQHEQVNARIRQAGLSPLHHIRRVVRLEEIPLLGTGKTDYRALRRGLAGTP